MPLALRNTIAIQISQIYLNEINTVYFNFVWLNSLLMGENGQVLQESLPLQENNSNMGMMLTRTRFKEISR